MGSLNVRGNHDLFCILEHYELVRNRLGKTQSFYHPKQLVKLKFPYIWALASHHWMNASAEFLLDAQKYFPVCIQLNTYLKILGPSALSTNPYIYHSIELSRPY